MSQSTAETHLPHLADRVTELSRFDGSSEQFLASLLAVQCETGSAERGAILCSDEGNDRWRPLACYPDDDSADPDPAWLREAGQVMPTVLSSGRSEVLPIHPPGALYGSAPRHHVVVLSLQQQTRAPFVAVFLVPERDRAATDEARQRLELTSTLLSLYELRQSAQKREADLARMRQACELLVAVNEHRRWKAAAMAMCNQLAAQVGAHRVGLGVLEGRYVKLEALSHTEKFTRQMKLVQAVESAMEETLDQDAEVIHPPAREATCVSRACGELARDHGPSAVACLPLRQEGQPRAVLTLERDAEHPFALEELETLRLTADLATPRLLDLYEHDRWAGARAAGWVRKHTGKLVGPEYTWVKLLALAVLAAVLLVTLLQGQYRVEAPFTIEAAELRVVPAPFEGYLATAAVEPGDRVVAGQTVLANLDASELEMQQAAEQAELSSALQEAAIARREGETADQEIALAQADRAQARIDLLAHRIEQARLVSPIEGVVVAGEHRQDLGSAVERGKMLFEIAPLEALRAVLAVPENRIADVQVGQRGQLASASYPGTYLPFEVEWINPVAEVADQRNVFRVRVRLLEHEPWLRPGMEGIGKVDVDRRSYAAIWSRDLIDWVRMKLWL
ncbi:MAG: efflux RND transporter periplasmic adaptor subunit [Phycisphaeraceae bacterium]